MSVKDLLYKTGAMTKSKYRVLDERYPYFITSSTVDWIPVFSISECVEIMLDSLNFLMVKRDIKLLGYVIMKDHFHCIVMGQGLPVKIGSMKSYTARKIIDHLIEQKNSTILSKLELKKGSYKKDSSYQLWQEGYHPQQIYSRKMMEQKLDYIHHNPVAGNYCAHPSEWLYSSYHNYYDTGKAVIPISDYVF